MPRAALRLRLPACLLALAALLPPERSFSLAGCRAPRLGPSSQAALPWGASSPVFGGAPRLARGAPAGRRGAADERALLLPDDDVVEAVSRAGSRVTVADVAAAGGIGLEKARKGLVTLAAALGSEANLEVSSSGELVYVFPPDPRAALAKASSAVALREAWNGAKPALFTGLRIAFGVALFASIAVIYTALIALSSSGSSDRRDDRRGGDGFGDSYGGGGGGGGFGFGFGPTLWYGPSPFDLFFYRPYYTYGGYEYYSEGAKPRMGFLEAVYSLVFGDGDPNAEREKKVLAAVAATARRNSGVLTAEQLAPLLDPPEYRRSAEALSVDESWVLGTLTRLNGRPEVTAEGQIVYVFDDLQTTAGSGRQGEKPPPIVEEQEVPFSLAEDDQLLLAGVLGVVNLVGAAYLGVQLSSLPAGLVVPGFLGLVKTWYPALLAYAIGFVAAPTVRYLSTDSTNSAIQERNRRRQDWLDVLRSGDVDGKLAQARTLRKSLRQISASDTVYTTASGAAAQGTKQDMDDFDKRLRGS